jgi:hypothetical protein
MRSVQKALETFSEAEHALASLVAFDLLASEAPRTYEGMSSGYRLVSAGGTTPVCRARRYIRAGFRHAIYAQRPAVLVWSFEQVLRSGDFQQHETEGIVGRIRGMITNGAEASDAEALMKEARRALKWLTSAAPEYSRALMDNAPSSYEKDSVRWLTKVAKAADTFDTAEEQ